MEKQICIKITSIEDWSGIKDFITSPSVEVGDFAIGYDENPVLGEETSISFSKEHSELWGEETAILTGIVVAIA